MVAEAVRIHPETGAELRRAVRALALTVEGRQVTIDQPGWWPEGEGDGLLDPDDLKIAGDAIRELKRRGGAALGGTAAK